MQTHSEFARWTAFMTSQFERLTLAIWLMIAQPYCLMRRLHEQAHLADGDLKLVKMGFPDSEPALWSR